MYAAHLFIAAWTYNEINNNKKTNKNYNNYFKTPSATIVHSDFRVRDETGPRDVYQGNKKCNNATIF